MAAPYSFAASLRIWHPSIDPAKLTKTLGLKPSRTWKVGEPRRTPKGAVLKGQNRDTYWFKKLVEKRAASTSTRNLEAFPSSASKRFKRHAKLFRRVRRTGGRAELFVGIFCESSNHGVQLPAEVLASLGITGLSLSLDVYR